MANGQNLKPFKPGHDPRRNTKGRPKDVWKVGFDDLLTNETGFAFYDAELLDDKGKPTGQTARVRVKLPKLELLIQTAAQKALKGDMRAMQIIMERMSGKPRQQIDANVTGTIQPPSIVQNIKIIDRSTE